MAASESVDVDHRPGEALRRLLGRVMADAALDETMLVLAGEALAVGGRFGMRGTIGVYDIEANLA